MSIAPAPFVRCVPSVTLLDLLFAYDTDAWRFALNVNNAADKTYVSTCLSRGDCWWGARRNVVASATYRF
ncbi:MAG: TonB-dependent receptor [Pseudorhodoferax sp.]